MSGKTRSLFLSLTIVAVILFSAFGTTSAYADGGTTADPPPTETTSGSKEADAGATDAASVEVSSAPETDAKATVEAAPAEAGSDGVSAELPAPQPTEEVAPAADTTVLDAVPENTTVTVVDAKGQEQPLATQAAAEAIVTSDPMWCPAGVAPGTAGLCTPSFGSFSELLAELSTNSSAYSGAGTIYVEQGAYTGGESVVDFNNFNLTNISGSDLTVMGGWDGTANPSGNAATPSTFNITSFMIGSPTNMWGGSLTLLNLSLNDPGLTGLALYSQRDVTLVNVDVTNSSDGAGADINAGGFVSIVDSNFSRNQTAGAIIRAGTGVFAVRSSFSNPETARRQDTGLDIETPGAVSLIDVFANENRLAGANINAGGGVAITRGFFSGTKEMTGSGPSTTFLGYGLQVVTPGAIDLISVTANDNFLWGARLQAGSAIAISDSIFNANTTASPGFIDDTGLFITSATTVVLNRVTASDNRLYGAQIGVLDPITGLATVTGTVTILESTFSNNRGVITSGGVTSYNGHGLQVNTQGDITLGNVTAENNMLFGAELNAGGAVSISNSRFNNNSTGVASNAVGVGLEINTPGNVSLLNVVANNNQTDGVRIQQGVCTSVNGGNFSGNGQQGLNLGSSALNLIVPPSGGNIFPANPPLCSLMLLGGGNTTTSAASNAFVSLQTASQQNASIPVTSGANGSAEVTLNSVLSKAANGGLGHSFFAGKYTYVYSDAGLQIFALSSSKDVAMREAFRAY